MKQKQIHRKIDATSYLMSRGIYWLALAILCPMFITYIQTYRTGETSVREQSGRILNFFMGEMEDVLGETERVIDGYLLHTQGSCLANDLLVLRRHLAKNNAVIAMGIIAADGKIACSIGDNAIQKLTFPAHAGETISNIEFAELRVEQGALPVLIKAAANGIRVYSVVSSYRFKKMLLPGFIADYAQIDIILPGGGLWYSFAGAAVSEGFSDDPLLLELKSKRFPVNISLILDKRSIAAWSGGLHVSLIAIVLTSFAALIFCFFAHRFYHAWIARRFIQRQMILIEHARLHFEITYQPLMNMDKTLLVGVLVKADVSLFDKVPDARPGVDEILAMMWDEIGEFALKRREFNIILQVDGESVVASSHRERVVDQLKAIGYDNLTLLMSWENDRGVDPDIYRPLEEVVTAGANLAIDCGNVQFSLLSDMWAWPYHQLVVDFSKLPDSDEAVNWISNIVMNMSEQLQIDTVAIGVETSSSCESAIGGGFSVGVGGYFGPALTIDSLLSAVRPVRGSGKRGAGDQDQNKAA